MSSQHYSNVTPWGKILLLFIGISSFLLILVISFFIIYHYQGLPEVAELQDVQLNEPLKIYTRDNKLIAEVGEINRTPVTYQQIPKKVINAFLAAEDSRFFNHFGIDLQSLLRAGWQYITDAKQQTGASTITMQLARNFYLTRKRTLLRKFKEILLAIKIEKELTKEQIITLYLNKIFLGKKSYGVAAAAKNYYSSDLEHLTLSQVATLAGLPKAPSRYNPVVNPERAKIRRDWIINRMRQLDYIDDATREQALQEDITPVPFWKKTDIDAPYIGEMARLQLLKGDILPTENRNESYIYNKGLKVYTSIDSAMQEAAKIAALDGLMEYEQRQGYKGAEQHFDLFDQSRDLIDEASIRKVLDNLSEISDFGGRIVPALVDQVEPNNILVLLADGSEIEIDRKQGFPFNGIYIDLDKRKKAGSYDKFLSPGDQIRIRKNEKNQWLIAQVPTVQTALSSIDPIDGAIRALVGGFYYYHSKFNRATQAERQLGSTIKPLIYSYAMTQGYRAGSIIIDSPLRFDQDNNWRPQNSDLNFLGPTTLRKALYKSRNLVSVRLLNQMSIKGTIAFLKQFDLSDNYPEDLSLALGSVSSTPIKVSRAFTIFANGGQLPQTYLIDRVEDYNNQVIYQAKPHGVCYRGIVTANYQQDQEQLLPINKSEEYQTSLGSQNQLEVDDFAFYLASPQQPQKTIKHEAPPLFTKTYSQRYCDDTDNQPPERILKPDLTYIINDILKDITRKGTAARVGREFKRKDFGGKTGTTNDNVDAWFTGVHPLLVTSVWVGYDSPRPLGRIEGGSRAALPVWINYMHQIKDRLPQAKLIKPDNIITDTYIDPTSGELVDKNYPGAIAEIFREDNLPPKSQKIIIRTKTGTATQVLDRPEDIF